MRILIIVNHEEKSPYIKELSTWLTKSGADVEVLDIIKMKHYKFGKDGLYLHQHILDNALLRRLVTLPKVGKYLKVRPLRKWLSRFNERYDVINLHYTHPLYVDYIDKLTALGEKLVAVVWGADFYEIGAADRERQREIYNRSQEIIFGNPGVAAAFLDYFNDYREKVNIVGFGIQKLDLIANEKIHLDRQEFRSYYKVEQGKLTVVCGYNGDKRQQHVWILQELIKLPEALKKMLHLFLPLTYGAGQAYIQQINSEASKTGISFTIFEHYMNEQETAVFRLNCDIVINAQLTDSLSASLQEHMFAGSLLLVGEWLPYQVFEEKGIRFNKFGMDNFLECFCELVAGFSGWLTEAKENPNKIYNMSSWKSRITQWMEVMNK